MIRWGMAVEQQVASSCWICGSAQTKNGWVGYGLGFWCPDCSVGWSVLVERSD